MFIRYMCDYESCSERFGQIVVLWAEAFFKKSGQYIFLAEYAQFSLMWTNVILQEHLMIGNIYTHQPL